MKFESLKKLQSYSNKEAPMVDSYVLENHPDIHMSYFEIGATYSKKVLLESGEYTINITVLDSNPEVGHLAFNSKGAEVVTNAGMSSFLELTQEIKNFTTVLRNECHFDMLVIDGASQYPLNQEQTVRMKTDIESSLEKNIHILDGIHYDQGQRAIKIEHGVLKELLPGLIEKFGVEDAWSTYKNEDFRRYIFELTTHYEVGLMKEIAQRIYSEIPQDLQKAFNKRADQQRMMLYKRVLKKSFPGLSVTETANGLVIGLKNS